MKVILTYKDPDYAYDCWNDLTEAQQQQLYKVSPGEYIEIELDLETGEATLLDVKTPADRLKQEIEGLTVENRVLMGRDAERVQDLSLLASIMKEHNKVCPVTNLSLLKQVDLGREEDK